MIDSEPPHGSSPSQGTAHYSGDGSEAEEDAAEFQRMLAGDDKTGIHGVKSEVVGSLGRAWVLMGTAWVSRELKE